MPDRPAPCSQPLASELLESFDKLNLSLIAFCTQLRQSDRALWIPRHDSESNSSERDFASSLIADIWYKDGQDGRRTRSRHGLIGADDSLLASAQTLNAHKAAFQQAASSLNAHHLRELPIQLAHRSSLLGEMLSRQGLGRIHLKQCYRQIPILERTPTRIGFNWYCSGRSIRRLTAADAMAMLLKLDQSQPHIQIQLARLSPLSADTPLAQLQTQVPVMRANIAWKQDASWLRQARNCPLPLLFPLAAGAALPQHNRPELEPPSARQRAERSDARIDPEPFIPSLRIHCYQHP
ncbi:DNA replication terminus site-binding protein [Marinobacterium rhizophilum]|uniref:DNA replication terminus site-binding protein n=1 Tax=Marinobacterium rhizophilum TaxID=420402 RepID=A0ABY5HMJ6_9GAMM|nr:DNA replication terminus site-binding protein [Marinobacterium rhizophilum]UTW13636.1 DNA replication terminus site-binding protein [Marinobacterium rhizophilum]